MGQVRKDTGQNQVYTDAFLSNFAFGLLGNPDEDYVSGKFVPITPVPKPSGLYRIFDQNSRAQFERPKAVVRAPHAEVGTSDFDWSQDNYNTEQYAHGTHLAPEELQASDQRVIFQKAKTRYVMQVIRQKHEIAFANAFFKAGVWGAAGSTDVTFDGTTIPYFSDFTMSDPIAYIAKERESMRITGGRWPNRLLVGPAVARALRTHPAILNSLSLSSDRVASIDVVARLLDLDSITVAGATKTTSVELAANPTFDFIFGRSMLLAYMSKNGEPDGLDASAARIFSWNGGNVGAPNENLIIPIQVIPRPLNEDERIQGKLNWGHKITGPYLAKFYSGVVAPTY
jgi:hypothetical protein